MARKKVTSKTESAQAATSKSDDSTRFLTVFLKKGMIRGQFYISDTLEKAKGAAPIKSKEEETQKPNATSNGFAQLQEQIIERIGVYRSLDDIMIMLHETNAELQFAFSVKLAERLLDYGINHTGVTSDVMRKMMIVNYANAIKLGGDNTKAEAILASHDWSATNAAFQICVAAIKDDFKAVVKQMESAVRSGEVAEEEFRSWPVFKKARGEKIFQDEFKTIFGRDLISVVSLDNKMDAKGQNDLDVSKANAVEIDADTPEKRTRH